MSLDKAIEYGKEKRKPYRFNYRKTRAKSVSHNCRNHGTCPWCQGNRIYKNKKREKIKENILDDEYLYNNMTKEEKDDFLNTFNEIINDIMNRNIEAFKELAKGD